MAVLIKTAPIAKEHSAGTICTFKETAYGEPVFGRQEKVYIWIDGGGWGGRDSRLYAEGMVVEEPSVEEGTGRSSVVRVKVVLTKVEPDRPMRLLEDIRPHRDDDADRTMHSLADIIYKNSHKKITMLSRDQAQMLGSRFD